MSTAVFDYLKFLTAGLLLTAFLCAPVACAMHADHKVAEMVKSGADPVAARCAIKVMDSQQALCAVNAARGK